MATFTVVYDANALWGAIPRDLLIRVAQVGLVRARWTDQILDETFRTIMAKRPGLDPERLARTRTLMNDAIRDVLVTGYEPLIEVLELPDPDDRHVLAAAIKVGAQMIVTDDKDDFPADQLAPWGIEARSTDHFLHAMVDLDSKVVFGEVQRIADSKKKPPMTVEDILDALAKASLVETVAALRS